MNRRDGWERRFYEVIESARRRRFSWAEHNCCTFPARVVEAVTGRNPIFVTPDRYATADKAMALIAEYGGMLPFVELALLKCGLGVRRCLNPLLLQRADVALIPSTLGPMLGVVLGETIVAPNVRAWERMPLATAELGWRI